MDVCDVEGDATQALLALCADRSRWDEELHAETVKDLVARGADVNARDASGMTPLHAAAAFGTAPVAQVLLERGAEVNAIDGLGRTPLAVARLMREDRWGVRSGRTADFDATLQALEAAGGKPRIPYARSADPFAPFPVDGDALLQALEAQGRALSFRHTPSSAQEAAAGLHSFGEPSKALGMLKVLRDTLGGGAAQGAPEGGPHAEPSLLPPWRPGSGRTPENPRALRGDRQRPRAMVSSPSEAPSRRATWCSATTTTTC